VAEIERAERAIELVGDGLDMLTEARGSRAGEGETAVKRGYLGLLHAREAIQARVREIAVAGQGKRRRLGRSR
jgi:hypothetical protein